MGDVIYMIDRIMAKLAPIQNVGLADRLIRFLSGVALMAYGFISIALEGSAVMPAVAILAGIYPLMTASVGWDPFYQLFKVRTCTVAGGRHQCGTLPYEVDAALGQNPKPARAYDHSYTATHRPKIPPAARR